MYDQYRERKAAADAKYRAKKARKEHDDEEWEGVSGDEKEGSDVDEDSALEEDSSDESDDEEGPTGKSLIRDLDNTPQDANGLSKRARGFFNQDIFQSIPGLLDVPESEEEEEEEEFEEEDVEMDGEVDGEEEEKEEEEVSEDDIPSIQEQKKLRKEKAASKKKQKEDDDFEVVGEEDSDDDWEEKEKKKKDGRPSKIFPLSQN